MLQPTMTAHCHLMAYCVIISSLLRTYPLLRHLLYSETLTVLVQHHFQSFNEFSSLISRQRKMQSKLRTTANLLLGLIGFAICFVAVCLWMKPWSNDFFENQGLTCNSDQSIGGFDGYCEFNRRNFIVGIDVLNFSDSHCLRSILAGPGGLRSEPYCLKEPEATIAMCGLSLWAKTYLCRLSMWATPNLVPSKFTVAVSMLAVLTLALAIGYAYRRFQKRKLEGKIMTIPHSSPWTSRPLLGAEAQDPEARRKRSHLNAVLLTEEWARKMREATNKTEAYY